MKKAAPELHIDLYGKCGPRKEKYLDAKEVCRSTQDDSLQ